MISGLPSRGILAQALLLLAGLSAGGDPALAGSSDPGDPPAAGSGWGLGIGVVSSPRPYVGAENELFPVPLVKYDRGGFFLEGIRIGYRWGGEASWSLELFGMPQFAGLDPDDDPYLDGMEERRNSFDVAATLGWTRGHLALSLSLYADLLGRNDGRRLRVKAGIPHQAGGWQLTPSVGAVWYDDDFVDYYAGVRPAEARPNRPAYPGHSTLNPEARFEAVRSFGRRWVLILIGEYQRLGSRITDSPIIEDRWILGGLAGVGFQF